MEGAPLDAVTHEHRDPDIRPDGAAYGTNGEHMPVGPRGAVTFVAGALLLSSCAWFGGATESVEHRGDRIVVNGTTTSDPLDDVVVAATLETPAGTLVIETYESELGGCYRLRSDEASAQPLGQSVGCLRGSGVHPDRPVTGTPDGSIEAINGGASNLALDDPTSEVGMFHHGLAHPDVAAITLEVDEGTARGGFPIVDAPNVPGLRVFLAWSTPNQDAYRLNAYDDQGCLLDGDQTVVVADGPDEGPGVRDLRPSCETRLPSQIRDVDVTIR